MSGITAMGTHNVFVYGSLMADEVVKLLLNRVPPSSLAILHGYHRFSIKERVYPAILPLPNHNVTGKVLFSITDPELRVLDEFEDVEYERSTIEVLLNDATEKLQAQTYVWSDKNDPNLHGEWDFEQWKRKDMADFMKMTMGFVEELELPDPRGRVSTYETFYGHDDESDRNPLES